MDFPISEMLEMLDKVGYTLTEEELATQLQRANHQVLRALPQDIYSIYFDKKSGLPPEPKTS
jgi:putative heme iron utilization protein